MALDHFKDGNYQGKMPWWNFNVLFDDQPAIQLMSQKYAPVLDHPGLYGPIPPKWLHATVLAVGPVSDYSEQEMAEVVNLLKPKLAALELPKFIFDSWWIWGGVVLHISPEDQFTKIYDCVIEALEAVVGPGRTKQAPTGNFLPHMTLAYARDHQHELELNRLLVSHPVQPVVFDNLSLALIKQYPKDGHYQWSVVRDLPIGTAEA